MAEQGTRSKLSAPTRPTITLPPRPAMDGLFSSGSGLSPGPMTLVSAFFSDPDSTDHRSFSQILAGAMASPGAILPYNSMDGSFVEVGFKDGGEKSPGFKQSRPLNLAVARSPLFTVPPGLSPSGLLNSPGFFCLSPQSPFGISHQQALAQVTAQAALAQSQVCAQTEYQTLSVAAPSEPLTRHPSFNPEGTSQQMPPSVSDPQSSAMEHTEGSQSDRKNQPSVAVDKPAEDGYNWRKYGQKPIKGCEYPRSYYKCTHLNCPVKKQVERSADGQITEIIYKGQHNHEKPQPNKQAKGVSDGNANAQSNPELGSQGVAGNFNKLSEIVPAHSIPGKNHESTQAAELPGLSDSEEGCDEESREERDDGDEPNPKRRNSAGETAVVLSHKTVTEPKIIVQTRSEVDLLDDGYRWRKYGQKVVKGNPHPKTKLHTKRKKNFPKMSLSTRQRRSSPLDLPSSSSSQPLEPESYSKVDKPGRSSSDGGEESGNDRGLGWFTVLFALGMLRYMSASSNIIHDCDEVFNYWEPLHYLLYKSGFQTWEYSSKFALRSYLYIIFHELVGQPASWLYADEKVRVFYAVRLFLGLLSVTSDATLVVAVSRKYGKRLASYALAMLCLASGCFFASTSFLPSSFSMYAMSLSSGLFLLEKPAWAVAVAAVGVILGWPFSILAFLPVTLSSLAKQFKQAFLSGAVTSTALLAFSILVDHYYYQRWTSSVFNLLMYNVLGGGESHLYGTEGPLFYIRNGFNNFNFCFIFALLFLGILPIARKKYAPDLFIVISPLYIWLAFMSLQLHKEERFLYPIYPLVCVAASAVIESFPDLFRDKYNPYNNSIIVMTAKILRPVALSLILCASHSRTFSLINGYAAPLEVYKILEHHDDAGTGSVLCVGSEWHRFPSSFFIPNYIGEVRWIDDGFRGLLPFPFNATLGGTSAAPPYFNNKNKASDEQYLQDLQACTFLVELQLNRPYPYRGNDLSTWEPIAALPYLDRELSPAKYRSFFIPYLWQQKNVFGMYKLLKRVSKPKR